MRLLRSHQNWARTLRIPFIVLAFTLISFNFSLADAIVPIKNAVTFGETTAVDPAAPAAIEPEPLIFQPLLADEAERLNAARVADPSAVKLAAPFSAGETGLEMVNRMAALDCLASTVYYEAASESLTGQRAVAQVVLNRVRHPAYPNSVCGVVFQGSERATGCQFTFTCDGALNRKRNARQWQVALGVAASALAGYVEPSVGTATHYHTVWVVPYWQSSLTKLTTIGAHIFYRWAGANGLPPAFRQRYAGLEKIGAPLLLNPLTIPTGEDAVADVLPNGPAQSPPELSRIGRDFGTFQPVVSQPIDGASVAADSKRSRLLADETRGELIVAEKSTGLQL